MPLSIIRRLVQSAFQTGCLSVESEGLICQVIRGRSYQTTDLPALEDLNKAIDAGKVKREAEETTQFLTMLQR